MFKHLNLYNRYSGKYKFEILKYKVDILKGWIYKLKHNSW